MGALSPPWSIPFDVRLGDALRRGRNVLELEVTNVAANRIRDMDRRGVNWKIMPFDASGWAVEPAGLLGPVELVPQRARR
jgi:hypothetical protein